VLIYPSHFGGSVCGRALSSNPFSSIGFERSHNEAAAHADEETFVRALLVDLPPPPADQAEIVAANIRGLSPTQA
jgi:hydroxyacylglutathione hydrolase